MPRSEQYVIPPEDFILVSATEVGADTELPANCRGLLVGTAGALNVVMTTGQERDNVPMIQGINPGFFRTVRVSTGGAQNVWAIV